MNIFRFLYQLICSHPVRKMKCECGEEYRKLCSWQDLTKEERKQIKDILE